MWKILEDDFFWEFREYADPVIYLHSARLKYLNTINIEVLFNHALIE